MSPARSSRPAAHSTSVSATDAPAITVIAASGDISWATPPARPALSPAQWERRRRVLEADVLARTALLGQSGWAAVLDALRPGMRWLGENRLQVNAHEYPPREISGARLVFVPITPQRTGWVAWEEREEREERERYAVVYPCSRVLADGNGTAAVPAALGPLLGDARARVLVLLDSPMSTTQLCAVTGQGLGSVGRHLRVLLDAGLVRRGRAGGPVGAVRADGGGGGAGTGHAFVSSGGGPLQPVRRRRPLQPP